MNDKIAIGFERQRIEIPLEKIQPTKVVPKTVTKSKKFEQIEMSVKEVGLVEPLIVFLQKGRQSNYALLDGHVRLLILKNIGAEHAPCILAKEDETFTYNKRISRLASVQEHYMILNAIENGASQERIATALGLNVQSIRTKRNLLNGICKEAVDALKDRHFPTGTIGVMRKMKPVRQVEMAELMVAANNFSISYARALLLATSDSQLKEPKKKREFHGISPDERIRMEQEMERLNRDMKAVQDDYGSNVLRMVVANGYVVGLLNNEHVAKYLARYHGELLTQLQALANSISTDTVPPSLTADIT